jgi:hypothetical protein
MHHALGMRHLGEGVEFPHWDLLLTPCHLNQVDPTSVKLAQGLQSTGDMKKHVSIMFPVMIPSQIFCLESLTTTDLLMCRCLLSYPVIKCVHTRFIHHMKIIIHSRYRSTSKDLTFYYEQYETNTIDSRSGTILRWSERQ